MLTTTSTPPNSSTVALHQCSEVIDVAEVGRHADRLAAKPTQMRRGLLAGLGFAAGHDDTRAGQDEALCQREADAAVPPVTMTVRSVMSKRRSNVVRSTPVSKQIGCRRHVLLHGLRWGAGDLLDVVGAAVVAVFAV